MMRIPWILFLIAISINVYSQTTFLIFENENNECIRKFKFKQPPDSVVIKAYSEKFMNSLYNNGFITAYIKNQVFDNDNIVISVNRNQQFILRNILTLDSINLKVRKKGEHRILLKPYNKNALDDYCNSILKFYENNGYPFAYISYSPQLIINNNIDIELKIQKNQFIKIDSIFIPGNKIVSNYFIRKKLNIKQNESFSQKKINNITKIVRNLEFIKELKPSDIEFHTGKANLYLYLEKVKSNQISGLIAISPSTSKDTKTKYSGDVYLKLTNTLKYGENLVLNWNGKENNSQKLNFNCQYPYAFRTSFGTGFLLNITKQDTTWIKLSAQIQLFRYLFDNDVFKAYYHYFQSSIINSKSGLSDNFANITLNLYGLAFERKNLDNLLNPKSGYKMLFSVAFGQRRILKSSTVLVTELESNLASYIPIREKFVLGLQNHTQFKICKKKVFDNEKYLLGGINSIRGFDDESMAVQHFNLLTFEFGLFIEKESKIFVFTDAAAISKNGFRIDDIPIGFGLGLNFTTKAGIFNLAYAYGKSDDIPFDANSGKIHIGFISIF